MGRLYTFGKEGLNGDQLLAVIRTGSGSSGFQMIGSRHVDVVDAGESGPSSFAIVGQKREDVDMVPSTRKTDFKLMGESKKKSRMPGLVSSAVKAVAFDLLSTQAGEEETVLDKMQRKWFLGGVNKVYKSAGSKDVIKMPTFETFNYLAKKVQKGVVEVGTLNPGGEVILSRYDMNRSIAADAENKLDLLLSLPTDLGIEAPLSQAEQEKASQLALTWLEKGEAAAHESLRVDLLARMQDLSLAEMKMKFGADYQRIHTMVHKIRNSVPNGSIVVDSLTGWAFPDYKEKFSQFIAVQNAPMTDSPLEVPVAKSAAYKIGPKGITYTINADDTDQFGDHVVEPRSFTLGWENVILPDELDAHGDAPRDGYVAQVKPAPFAVTVSKKLPNWAKPFVGGSKLNDLVGMIVFKPAGGDVNRGQIEIPPILCRSPKRVLQELGQIKMAMDSLAEIEEVAATVIGTPDSREGVMIRPKMVMEEARKLEAGAVIPIFVEEVVERGRRYKKAEIALSSVTNTNQKKVLERVMREEREAALAIKDQIKKRQAVLGDSSLFQDVVARHSKQKS